MTSHSHTIGGPQLNLRPVLLSGLLLLPLLLAAADAANAQGENLKIDLVAVGARSGTVYRPQAEGTFTADSPIGWRADTPDCSLPSDSSGCADRGPIPANEWVWMTIRVSTSDGTPAAGRAVYFAFEGTPRYSRLDTTDSQGLVRFLHPVRPYPMNVEALVSAWDGSVRTTRFFDWVIAGEVPRDPWEFFLAPEEGWLEYEVVPTRPGPFFAWANGGFTEAPQGPQSFYAADVRFEVNDSTPYAFGSGIYALFSQDPSVSAGVVTPEAQAEAHFDTRTPMKGIVLGPSIPFTGSIFSGFASSDRLLIRGVIARAGMEHNKEVGLMIYAEPGSYEVRVLRSGTVHISTPIKHSSGVSVAAGAGAYNGLYESRLHVGKEDTVVFGLARAVSALADGRVSLRHGTFETTSGPGEVPSVLVAQEGACAGDWLASFDGTSTSNGPDLVIAEAPGLPLSDWFKAHLRVGQCD